jgi:hypothetical protein
MFTVLGIYIRMKSLLDGILSDREQDAVKFREKVAGGAF